jgi:ornithine cyclodeaminase/alanine dehydrogenase-like protein (mu-crystallin family)
VTEPAPRVIDAAAIDRALDFPSLIAALDRAFAGDIAVPPRHHHDIARSGAASATHLIMPAFTGGAPGPGAFLGTKIVNVFPDNSRLGLPAVLGAYLLQSGETGAPLAVMDGARLTHWRTAAASALAARFLARIDASRLLMVGAGALAPFLIRAPARVRSIREVTLWNHRRDSAERLAAALAGEAFSVKVGDNLEAAVRAADIVSCATLSTEPLVMGAWLQPGQHLDLVGAFNLRMREADDVAIQRARVFIDTPAALGEGGDVALAIKARAIVEAHVEANLAQLCRGDVQVARGAGDITLFKSVGAAIEDLAAAMLVWERLDRAPPGAS